MAGSTGTLLVANHIFWLDILGLLAVEPTAFLAKRKVADWPVFGPIRHPDGPSSVGRSAL